CGACRQLGLEAAVSVGDTLLHRGAGTRRLASGLPCAPWVVHAGRRAHRGATVVVTHLAVGSTVDGGLDQAVVGITGAGDQVGAVTGGTCSRAWVRDVCARGVDAARVVTRHTHTVVGCTVGLGSHQAAVVIALTVDKRVTVARPAQERARVGQAVAHAGVGLAARTGRGRGTHAAIFAAVGPHLVEATVHAEDTLDECPTVARRPRRGALVDPHAGIHHVVAVGQLRGVHGVAVRRIVVRACG